MPIPKTAPKLIGYAKASFLEIWAAIPPPINPPVFVWSELRFPEHEKSLQFLAKKIHPVLLGRNIAETWCKFFLSPLRRVSYYYLPELEWPCKRKEYVKAGLLIGTGIKKAPKWMLFFLQNLCVRSCSVILLLYEWYQDGKNKNNLLNIDKNWCSKKSNGIRTII